LATGAQAATLTVTAPTAGLEQYYGIGDVILPAFNKALGTLTGLTISTVAFLSEGATVAPAGPGPLPMVGTFNTFFTASVIGTSPYPSYTAPVQSVQAVVTPVNYLPGQTAGTADVQARFSNSFSISDAAVATGGFLLYGDPLDVRYTISASPTAGLNFALGDASRFIRANVTASATYTYDPAGTAVPEPASLVLLGAGLAGALAARKALALRPTSRLLPSPGIA